MEEYFPDVAAIIEKRKKERAPLRGAGVLFRNTRPPQTELSKMRERGGDGEEGCYGRGPGGNRQRVGGGIGGRGEGRTVEGSPPAPFPPQQKGEETEETDPRALTDASRKGDLLKVKHIIEGGRAKLNMDWQDENGKTALMGASENGHTDIVRLLVDAKANVDMQDKNGQTALILASENGHMDIVRLLVDARANVDIQDTEGNTVLMLAIQKEDVEMVEYLLVRPGSATQTVVNIPDSQGRTPLFRAAAGGHILLVEFLLRRGADPSLKDASGHTALAVAEEKGD
uniref:Uncharacterized protein n=1 Tax=Chromera velia CCMP2878 TaxID=1169474 RepID=A0A0G4ID66_9ALVE|eukprot:Cvel_2324.t1-p1 / transcript=Cvel_2324.t1 / gene=Cvel_2324 / organism=Chromera_velia_CCMP2878 / gene_product=Putative ankyrin repeat protein MM_0045, putative / transcript_product=Putative ankyrin repeat protein MM_0045, putative / location=Cvel_scaffold89:128281-129802(-) / protein_length=284 / sequence_SO=supercontig / SO=protein_coding / is_pseudo=false